MLNVSPQMTLAELIGQLPEDHTAVVEYNELKQLASRPFAESEKSPMVAAPSEQLSWADVNGAPAPIHPSLISAEEPGTSEPYL